MCLILSSPSTSPWQCDHAVHTPPKIPDPGQQNKIKLFKVKKKYWFPVEKLVFIEKYADWCWVGWLDEYNLNKMEMLCFALLKQIFTKRFLFR